MEYETEDGVLSSFYKMIANESYASKVFTTKSIPSALFALQIRKMSNQFCVNLNPEDVDFCPDGSRGLEEAGRAASNTAQGGLGPKIVTE